MNLDLKHHGDYCDLCCGPVDYQYGRRDWLAVFTSARSGSEEGLVKEQVLLYFVVKKLLKFTDEQFLELLMCLRRRSEHGREERGEELEGFYFRKFCVKCEGIISESMGVQRKVVGLQRRISELGEGLREIIRLGGERKTSNGKGFSRSITRKIKSFICPETENEDGCRSEVNEQLETVDDTRDVKVEPDDNCEYLENINESLEESHYDDHFDDDDHLDRMSPNEKCANENRKHKRRKESENDSDSDFNPEEKLPLSRSGKKKTPGMKLTSSSLSKRKVGTSISTKLSIDQNRNGFTCDICNMVQKTARGFRLHLKAHEESSRVHGNKYDCPKCKYPALSEWKLRYHLTIAHRETHNNTCSICGYVGSRRWVYEKHMKEKHDIQVWTPIDKDEECKDKVEPEVTSQEGKVSGEQGIADNPTQSNSEQYRCTKCNTGYKTRMFYERHQAVHRISAAQNHKFDCDVCHFPANSEKFLRYHKRKEHKQYLMRTCNLCGHQVKRLDQMKLHMKTKHNNEKLLLPVEESENKNDCESASIEESKIATFGELVKVEPTTDISTKVSASQNQKPEDECGFPSNSKKRLRYHKRRQQHKRDLMHTCSLCEHQEKRLDQMKLHMIMNHNQLVPRKKSKTKWSDHKMDGRFQCQLCKYNYSDSGSLKRHMSDHEKCNEMDKKWECTRCGFPCLSQTRLDRHIQVKHEKSPLTCSICQRTFGRQYLLKAHMLKHQQFDRALDPTSGLFCCDICPNKQFNSVAGLILHKTQMHPDANNCVDTGGVAEDSHLCPHCGRCYTNKAQLRRHIRTRHDGIRSHTCDICGKGIEGKTQLEEHRKIHLENRVKEFVCDICGSAYSHKYTLNKHLEKYHSEGSMTMAAKKKSYKCKFCTEVFQFKLLLEKHMESFHQDMYTFKCDHCNKSYISASSLRLHQEISHGEGGGKTQSCEYCGKQFVHKHYVICHYKWCEVKRKQGLTRESTDNNNSTVRQ